MNNYLRSLRSLLPSARDYRKVRYTWKGDLLAGLTVGIVALPLALAFGVSSGAGAESGIITAIIAGLVAAIFGGSNVQVSGPTGAMVVVLAPIIGEYGKGALALVTIMGGLIVLAAGLLRLGQAISFIPWTVIEGFTAGIGIIIFLQQVPTALGVGTESLPTNAAAAAFKAILVAPWPKAFLPVGAVVAVAVLMFLFKKFIPQIPESFAAIVVVTTVVVLAKIPLQPIGDLPAILQAPEVPEVTGDLISALIGPAFAIAALAGIESLLSARVAATLGDTGALNSDRELFGQGLASIASGLFGGMPATGAIARTAVNVRAGAKTRLASIFHALVLLFVVLFAAVVVSKIPLAALAGVLMVTAYNMVSVQMARKITLSSKSAATTFWGTMIITVAFDLVVAVGIGLAAAALFALVKLSRLSHAHREELPGEPQPGDEKIALFEIDGSLFFGATENLLETVTNEPDVKVLILQLNKLDVVDATGANALAEMVRGLERRGVTVIIKGVQSPHWELFKKLGVIEALRHSDHLLDDLEPAVAHARGHVARLEAGEAIPEPSPEPITGPGNPQPH